MITRLAAVFAFALVLLRPMPVNLEAPFRIHNVATGANIYAPSVLFDDGVYKMWYGGWQSPTETKYDKIFYRTSPDNVRWSEPVLLLQPSSVGPNVQHINDPSVTKVLNTVTGKWQYTMFFTVCHFPCHAPDNQIWSAVSADGLKWEHLQPLLAQRTGAYAPASVFEQTATQVWRVYYSETTDCQKIKMSSVDGSRRVVSTQVVFELPGHCISDPAVARLGDSWHLYFTRHYLDRTDIFQAASATNLSWTGAREAVANRGPAFCAAITPDVLQTPGGGFDLYYGVAIRRSPGSCDLSQNALIQRSRHEA